MPISTKPSTSPSSSRLQIRPRPTVLYRNPEILALRKMTPGSKTKKVGDENKSTSHLVETHRAKLRQFRRFYAELTDPKSNQALEPSIVKSILNKINSCPGVLETAKRVAPLVQSDGVEIVDKIPWPEAWREGRSSWHSSWVYICSYAKEFDVIEREGQTLPASEHLQSPNFDKLENANAKSLPQARTKDEEPAGHSPEPPQSLLPPLSPLSPRSLQSWGSVTSNVEDQACVGEQARPNSPTTWEIDAMLSQLSETTIDNPSMYQDLATVSYPTLNDSDPATVNDPATASGTEGDDMLLTKDDASQLYRYWAKRHNAKVRARKKAGETAARGKLDNADC
ncbi:hypothetical protein G7046_g8451 [Stylonectria norvegica]|nr:hypothetical protein G7046_g8451 [Stylonectria norvegica]